MTRTREEIEIIVNDLGYELLDEYSSNKGGHKMVVIQDKYGYKYNSQLHHLIRGIVPYIVTKDKPFSLYNISVWLKLNNKNFKLCEDNIYEGKDNNLFFYCFKCKDVFTACWHHLSERNTECALCIGRQVGKYNNLEYLEPELSKQWIESEHNLLPNQVTKSCKEKVLWQCPYVEEHTWITAVYSRTNGKSGCPKCKESLGEKETNRVLLKYNINKIHQHNFNGCIGIRKGKNRKLKFDFYLPDYNLCIEMQSGQHFFPVDFAGKGIEWAKENFERGQIRDQIKRDYCQENGINLLEIPYWEFDNGNIESILTDYLNL